MVRTRTPALSPKPKTDKFRYFSFLNPSRAVVIRFRWVQDQVTLASNEFHELHYSFSNSLLVLMCALAHYVFSASITLNHDQIISGLLARDHACKYHTLILHLDFV